MATLAQQLKKPHFGLHITIDAYGCDEAVLDNPVMSKRYLFSLLRNMKMKKLFGPIVVETKGNGHKDPGGNSGFLMIQESHFSVHTFPRRRFVSIDIYSCRDFNYKRAVTFTKKFFHARSVEIAIVVRGKRYPMKNLY